MRRGLGALCRLGRPSAVLTVWSGALAGVFLSAGPPRWWLFGGLGAALSLAYCGGMALNDAYDAPLDAILRPQRPIPRGEIGVPTALALGYAALAAAVGLVAGLAGWPEQPGGWAAAGAALILAGLIVLYDTSHEGHSGAPALAGLCRGLVYVTSAVAAAGRLNASSLGAAAVLGCYTAGVCGAGEGQEGPRLWPIVLLAAPLAATGTLLAAEDISLSLLWLFSLAWVARCSVLLLRREFSRAARGLTAALCLADALLIAQLGPSPLVWAAAAGFPLTLALQRLFPAA